MVEFVGKFDSNATKSLVQHQYKKGWVVFLIVSLLFITVGIVCLLASDIIFGVVMIAVGVLFTPVVLIIANQMQKKMDKSMSVMSEETVEVYQFYPDKLIITQQKGDDYESTTTAKYSYLYKVEETQTHYFLNISQAQFHVVNKANLTQGTIEELNTIFYANLGASFTPAK